MSAAWQDALVVRSADGVLWLRTSSTEWPWRRRFDHTQATHDGLIVKDVDPTPVLDSEGLPIVRTVGDLTARHIGKRVRAMGLEGQLLGIAGGAWGGPGVTVSLIIGSDYLTHRELLQLPVEVLP